MGMYQDFAKMRDSLFSAFADFVYTDITFSDDPTSTYDPATGKNVVSYGNTGTTTGFFRMFSQDEIGGEIQSGDGMVILKHDDVNEPLQPNGRLTIDGVGYSVIQNIPTPFKNTIIQKLQVRRVAS